MPFLTGRPHDRRLYYPQSFSQQSSTAPVYGLISALLFFSLAAWFLILIEVLGKHAFIAVAIPQCWLSSTLVRTAHFELLNKDYY